jgi:branched-chain amino acid aminotransferase
MHRFLLYNGDIRGTNEALVSPGQTGFMNGWGIFSTLQVLDGILFEYQRHYARMKRDAELTHVPLPYSSDELERQLLQLVNANSAENAVLRVAIVRNSGGVFEGPGTGRDSDLIAFTADLTNWGSGVRLYYVPSGRFGASPFAGTKITSWAQNLTWYEQAHQRGYDEVILLNEHGHVSECTSANIFVVRGNVVSTPPLTTSGCLPGITRAVLLREIKVPGISILEQEFTPMELEAADAVFITSTTRNVLPVLEVGHTQLNQSTEVVSQLQAAFRSYQQRYVNSQSKKREALTT